MKRNLLFIGCILLFSCNRKPAEDTYNEIVDIEIARRVEMITQASSDTAKKQVLPDVSIIQKEIANLILLTKDAENSDAVVQKANAYFQDATNEYQVPYEGFVVLIKTMSLPTMEATIKTNELNLLDKIIFTRESLTNDSTMMSSVY